MHLVTATGHAWNYSLRMALKGTCQFVASRGLKFKTFILLSCYFSFGLTSDVWCALCCLKSSLNVTSLPFHLLSIAMGCIYTEAKNYPREPAAHVAISEFSCTIFYLFYLLFVIQEDVLRTRKFLATFNLTLFFSHGGEAMIFICKGHKRK
jgi:hypothetical protein